MRGPAKTLLVAEDSDSVRRVVVTLLEDAGYHVIAARDGEEAVRIADQRGTTIHLALLDVVMPKLSGPEAYARIASEHAHVRVVYTTGYGEAFPGSEDIGGHTLIRKPYAVEELLTRIEQALAG